jgi:hypothetical protein
MTLSCYTLPLQETAAAVTAVAQPQARPAEGGLESNVAARTDQQLDPLQRPNVSPLVRAQETRIRDDLAKLHLNERPEKGVDLLIEHLAISQLLHAAEQLYRFIFGSQIAVLKHLNLSGCATEEQVQELGEFKQTSQKSHRILSKSLSDNWFCPFRASQF